MMCEFLQEFLTADPATAAAAWVGGFTMVLFSFVVSWGAGQVLRFLGEN